ncbi:MAG: hypothetical protein QOD99_1258 [Chthoniobacter sp.]|nr:hypothetical protein [Chthoniobacter sp.]
MSVGNPAFELLDRVAADPAIQQKRVEIDRGHTVLFEHVTPAAQPFLAAVLMRDAGRRTWIVCDNVRAQESFHGELCNWIPEALFFPEAEIGLGENAIADPEIAAERLHVLQTLNTVRGPQTVVLTRGSLDEKVPSPEGLKRLAVKLARGAAIDRDKLLAQLSEAGYEAVTQVALRGQFAVRGGIIDVFSWQHTQPVRVEFFGDEIESIRQFDLDAQTSALQLDVCTLLLGESGGKTCPLREYFRKSDVEIEAVSESSEVRVSLHLEGNRAEQNAAEGVREEAGVEDFSTAFFDHGLGEFEVGDFVVDERKRQQFFQQLEEWRQGGWRTFIFCNNEGEVERLQELIPDYEHEHIAFPIGLIAHGFTFPAAKTAVLSDAELFGRYRTTRARRISLRRARDQANRAQIDFSELHEDDYVVHLEHGIGRYLGLQSFATGEKEEEVLVLEFADEAKLYVPLEQSFLVSRYVGVGKKSPALSSLADQRWAKAKSSAQTAIFDYAARLLTVHAERETSVGFAFPPDNKWQHEFESAFVFKETPDQLTAIEATKTDMEGERPMDRLICGDVGFGKTEVAIRAAFKAVMAGKQVAVLVPTTVLAQQHFQNFRERMSDYPVTIEMLSRFRSHSEQRKVLTQTRAGSVDIIIGTHRLISKDVEFKNLGLVVIDEEQRFGVAHKERFKHMFNLVDVLTLSATPIPRTLYLSLMGAKDMSIIETPPANRIPTETMICGYDERIIRDAINRELARQGQVYFLHNRVHSIERVAKRIAELCPSARIEIGHGQMHEDDLEHVMQRFVNGESDVLVSTTIIESGLDIPNANTIIIDRADRFGLADLYQLRGRVGRAQHKAYAYLMLPRDLMTVGAARKRINAIKQYSSLGAGFKIAMRDLEIRGAGNILGTAQSGHIVAIGFELYCQLLKQAVAKLKGEKVRPRLETVLRLDFVLTNEAEFLQKSDAQLAPALLPTSFITEPQMRIQAYRKLAEIATQEQVDALRKEWRDRFGRAPEAVENLLAMTEMKLAAAARRVSRVEVREDKLMLTRGGDFILIGGKFPRLTVGKSSEKLRQALEMIRAL